MNKKTVDVISNYLGISQKSIYTNEYWKDPMHEKLYMKAYEENLDPADADRYVYLYDMLLRDVGIENFRTINTVMWKKYDMELLEANSATENEEWQVLCQVLKEVED